MKKKMKIFITFIFCSFLILCPTQQAICADESGSIADAVPFLGIEEAAKILKKAVCAIQVPGEPTKDGKNTWVLIGSGFLIKDERNVTLAITCNHVVQIAIKMNQPVIYIGIDTDKGYYRAPSVVAYTDPSLDIAVLVPHHEKHQDDLKFQSLAFGKDLFDNGNVIVEGRGVIIPGYPLGLGTENDQNHPVIRMGFVAQYTGKDYFLLDGVASHGNSGSPVFSLKVNDNKLIGMVTSFQPDTINLFDENQQLSMRLPYNSGLGRCVTMKAILEAVKKAKY
ncbi:MAG: serine protease [Syntrophales bacterium]